MPGERGVVAAGDGDGSPLPLHWTLRLLGGGGWGRVRRKKRRRSEGRERQFGFFDSIRFEGSSRCFRFGVRALSFSAQRGEARGPIRSISFKAC